MPLCARPGGLKLDQELEPGDIAVFPKLDLSFRSPRDAAEVLECWLSRGINIHILDQNMVSSAPMGQLFVAVLGRYLELQRTWRSERAKDSIAHRKSLGQPTSGKALTRLRSVIIGCTVSTTRDLGAS